MDPVGHDSFGRMTAGARKTRFIVRTSPQYCQGAAGSTVHPHFPGLSPNPAFSRGVGKSMSISQPGPEGRDCFHPRPCTPVGEARPAPLPAVASGVTPPLPRGPTFTRPITPTPITPTPITRTFITRTRERTPSWPATGPSTARRTELRNLRHKRAAGLAGERVRRHTPHSAASGGQDNSGSARDCSSTRYCGRPLRSLMVVSPSTPRCRNSVA